MWAAVAAAVGDGIDAADVGDRRRRRPTSTDGIADAARPASVGAASATGRCGRPVADADNPRGVDVVVLDQAELALVFGQIAPGKVAAPNPALTFRVESPFTDEQLAATGLTNDDVAYRGDLAAAVRRRQRAVGGHRAGDAPAGDRRSRSPTSRWSPGADGADVLFGDDRRAASAEQPIVGVDAVVRLGTSYLDLLADSAPRRPTAADAPTTAGDRR